MTVFLSYSWKDRYLVERIGNFLLEHNIKFWRDDWQLMPGDLLSDRILDAIRTCSYFCIVLTRASVSSDFVARELEAACKSELAAKSGFFLPLLMEDCDVPAALQNVLTIDFRADFEKGLQRLVERVGRKYNTNYSGSLDDERDYWFDYGVRTKSAEDLTLFELDIVAYDNEAPYSVLAQVTIECQVPICRSDAAGQLNVQFFQRLMAQYPRDCLWIRLKADEPFERSFDMSPYGDQPAASLYLRIVRLGSVPGGFQIFPLHRYLVQVCRTQGIEALE